MVSSAPASSEPIRRAPAGGASPAGPVGAEYPSSWVRFLTGPAAHFATTWAALLLSLTVVGVIPALVAATRTTTNLSEFSDRAFRETLQHGCRLLRRDGPISAVMWAVLALAAGDVLILVRLAEGGTRVFLVGLALPPLWAVISLLSAYVVVAAEAGVRESRRDLALRALALAARRPLRALCAPALIVALSPLWLLAPLTIAIGFSVPPYVLASLWGEESEGSGSRR